MSDQQNDARGENALTGIAFRLEAGLLSSNDPLARILDLAEDAIISIDGEQRIILFNRGVEKIFGYKADEVRGITLDVLLPPRVVEIHRKHIREFAESATPGGWGNAARSSVSERTVRSSRRSEHLQDRS